MLIDVFRLAAVGQFDDFRKGFETCIGMANERALASAEAEEFFRRERLITKDQDLVTTEEGIELLHRICRG